jgi:3-oxoacyl-[acyl-carrier-protein] synthase-3
MKQGGIKPLNPAMLCYAMLYNKILSSHKILRLLSIRLISRYKGTPVEISTPEPITLESAGYENLAMNGQNVYKFATREVPRVVSEALEEANMTPDDIDWLLLHQANIRIMETVAKRLKIPKEKIITNLADYGNTSAGSIPIALSEAVRSGQVKKGDIIACAGFGAGLSWGSAIMRWG